VREVEDRREGCEAQRGLTRRWRKALWRWCLDDDKQAVAPGGKVKSRAGDGPEAAFCLDASARLAQEEEVDHGRKVEFASECSEVGGKAEVFLFAPDAGPVQKELLLPVGRVVEEDRGAHEGGCPYGADCTQSSGRGGGRGAVGQ